MSIQPELMARIRHMAYGINPRTEMVRYALRNSSGRPNDYVMAWERRVGGTRYSFTRIAWVGGRNGYTLTVRIAGKADILHKFELTADGAWMQRCDKNPATCDTEAATDPDCYYHG